MSQLGRSQPQPVVVSRTPPGLATANVTDTETATTTTAATVAGQGTQPIVVTAEPSKAFWAQQHQPPALVSQTPPGLVTADVADTETVSATATASGVAAVTDTETVSTSTATTVAGQGTQPVVVTADPSRLFWNQAHQPPALVSQTPPGLVTADVADTVTASTTATAATGANVTDTETVTTTTAVTVAGQGTQPIVASADPSRLFWNQAHQPPAIVSATPPALATANVTDTETVSTTATAATGANVTDTETATTTTAATVAGQGTAPIVVSDLTGTYWSLERQRAAIVVISPPAAVGADVADTETVSTTATASALAPPTPAQPVVYSDQLAPYLARALSHQPPAQLIVPLTGVYLGQVADTETVATTATATTASNVTGTVTDTDLDTTTATAAATTPVKPGGSWYSLLLTLRDASDPDYLGLPLEAKLACPNDGEPFSTGPDGDLFCQFDGYRPGSYKPSQIPASVGANSGYQVVAEVLSEWRWAPRPQEAPDNPPGWGP